MIFQHLCFYVLNSPAKYALAKGLFAQNPAGPNLEAL
jgi:hypothetical protein